MTDITAQCGAAIEYVAFGSGEIDRACYFAAHGYILLGARTFRPHTGRRRVKIFALRAQCGRDVRVPAVVALQRSRTLNKAIDFLGKVI